MSLSVNERWEALSNLFGAYLNQELTSEYGGPWEAVHAYRCDEPTEVALRTAAQARDLARSTEDEQELRALMLDLGIEYAPWADGWNSHAWLEHLAVTLRT